jgi:hypothetical protein
MTTKHQAPKPSVTKETGKTDKIADDGVITVAPEGTGTNDDQPANGAANPHPAYHINGQPVSKEEYERSIG